MKKWIICTVVLFLCAIVLIRVSNASVVIRGRGYTASRFAPYDAYLTYDFSNRTVGESNWIANIGSSGFGKSAFRAFPLSAEPSVYTPQWVVTNGHTVAQFDGIDDSIVEAPIGEGWKNFGELADGVNEGVISQWVYLKDVDNRSRAVWSFEGHPSSNRHNIQCVIFAAGTDGRVNLNCWSNGVRMWTIQSQYSVATSRTNQWMNIAVQSIDGDSSFPELYIDGARVSLFYSNSASVATRDAFFDDLANSPPYLTNFFYGRTEGNQSHSTNQYRERYFYKYQAELWFWTNTMDAATISNLVWATCPTNL